MSTSSIHGFPVCANCGLPMICSCHDGVTPPADTTAPTQRHQTVNPHSVELSLTSAGKVSGSVKVYAEDPAAAFERAAEILDQIRKRYPQT